MQVLKIRSIKTNKYLIMYYRKYKLSGVNYGKVKMVFNGPIKGFFPITFGVLHLLYYEH